MLSLKPRGSLYSPIVNMLQIVSSVYGAERTHAHVYGAERARARTHTHTESTHVCAVLYSHRSGNPSLEEPNQTPLVLKQCNFLYLISKLKIVEN